MDKPKVNQGGLVVGAASMGASSPPVSQSSYPQAAYPLMPPPGYLQNNAQGIQAASGPVPVGFKTPPYPQNNPQVFPEGSPQHYPPPGYSPPVYEDNTIIYANQSGGEDGGFKLFDFTEQSIRRAFVRKVYGILMCQLLVSLAVISLFLFCRPVRLWASENPYMLLIALVVYFVMAILMICVGEVRRRAPMNFIFLGIFTLATSYLLGTATGCLDVDVVMIAVGLTAAVVLALTLYAFQTKYDFTGWGGGLLCALLIFMLFGIICAFIPHRVMDVLYSAVGALIFSIYIVYDTQLMLGGKHKYTITPEEYIFAALNLYLDVVNLFLHILYLVARR